MTDKIITPPSTEEYRQNFDAIFRKPPERPFVQNVPIRDSYMETDREYNDEH